MSAHTVRRKEKAMLPTQQELEMIILEVTKNKPYDVLCKTVYRTLPPYIAQLCYGSPIMRGSGSEDDILQDTVYKLTRFILSGFILREPKEKKPADLQSWMCRIAHNTFLDALSKRTREATQRADIDDEGMREIKDSADEIHREREMHCERLKQCVATVLSCDSAVYKTLTWMAYCILTVKCNKNSSQATGYVAEKFADKTLGEMYAMIVEASKSIDWLKISPEENEKILRKLRKTHSGNVTYSETLYRDFFMKYNGEVSPKKSVSDWTNRMNTLIRKSAAGSDMSDDDNKPKGNPISRRGGNGPLNS